MRSNVSFAGLSFFGDTLLPDRDLSEVGADAQKTAGAQPTAGDCHSSIWKKRGGGRTAAVARAGLALQVARRGGVRPLLPKRWRRRRGAWGKIALLPCINLNIRARRPNISDIPTRRRCVDISRSKSIYKLRNSPSSPLVTCGSALRRAVTVERRRARPIEIREYPSSRCANLAFYRGLCAVASIPASSRPVTGVRADAAISPKLIIYCVRID